MVHIDGRLDKIERSLFDGLDEDYKKKIQKSGDPANQSTRRMARPVASGAFVDASKPKKPNPTQSKAHDRTKQQVAAAARRERRAPVRDRHRPLTERAAARRPRYRAAPAPAARNRCLRIRSIKRRGQRCLTRRTVTSITRRAPVG